MTQPEPLDDDQAADQPTGGLVRTTFNATPVAQAAIAALMAARGSSRTDAINRALAVAALIDRLSDDHGSLRVVAADGTTERIYLV